MSHLRWQVFRPVVIENQVKGGYVYSRHRYGFSVDQLLGPFYFLVVMYIWDFYNGRSLVKIVACLSWLSANYEAISLLSSNETFDLLRVLWMTDDLSSHVLLSTHVISFPTDLQRLKPNSNLGIIL